MTAKILNKRQEIILSLLENGGEFEISAIRKHLQKTWAEITKITVNRDLKYLIDLNYVRSHGLARATSYSLSDHYNLIRPLEVEKYFGTEADRRIVKERFDFDVFSHLREIFTEQEKARLNGLDKIYRKNIARIPDSLHRQELKRLIIELSWKSSQIEGNTYSLLETEALIERNETAAGHQEKEAVMILNHKETLDYIGQNYAAFAKISVAKIEDIHYLLTKNLGIARGLRKTTVGITGTKYRPLDNSHQIKEALEKACDLVNAEKNPFAKAIILSLLIAYIQPFADGNKRTSRLTANAILLAHGSCPLSYRNASETEYKKAVVLFYEQNNLAYFKQLFTEQFAFAVENYFQS